MKLALEAIQNDEIVGIPTETVYGIGVSPFSQKAVDKIFSLKNRNESKPLAILVSSFFDLPKLKIKTIIPEVVELYWPGPLTIVVESELDFANGVGTKSPNSIGIRVPDNSVAIDFLKLTGPLAVTSANQSGEMDVNNNTDAQKLFGNKIHYYLEGTSSYGSGSTVLDLRIDGGKILREGPLKWPPSYC